MTPHEVRIVEPAPRPHAFHDALSEARRRVIAAGQWTPCPRLPRVAFSAAALEGQLDAAARTFIGENRNVWIDQAKREVFSRQFSISIPKIFSHTHRA
jgi:hypothetical protein